MKISYTKWDSTRSWTIKTQLFKMYKRKIQLTWRRQAMNLRSHHGLLYRLIIDPRNPNTNLRLGLISISRTEVKKQPISLNSPKPVKSQRRLNFDFDHQVSSYRKWKKKKWNWKEERKEIEKEINFSFNKKLKRKYKKKIIYLKYN